jgi:hypothetical protein
MLIRSKNLPAIRIWVSFLAAYKAVQYEGKVDFSSIIEKAPALDPKMLSDFKAFVPLFWSYIQGRARGRSLEPQLKATHRPIYSAGPNHSISILGAARDAYSWTKIGPLFNEGLEEWCHLTGNYAIFEEVCEIAAFWRFDTTSALTQQERDAAFKEEIRKSGPYRVGKIALKYEPAGKVRVFAIVDYWTQTLLRPLHRWMFSILRLLPADATFDQEGALNSFMSLKEVKTFSYDLKSATDLIPLRLYAELFTGFLSHEIVKTWLKLLVGREYFYFPNPKDRLDAMALSYGRGQPMGAYSSWASLAILHHAIVLFAAFRVGYYPREYSAYRVLGDDVVIGKEDVAKSYVEVCRALSIPIGLPKSFISPTGGVNFASQTIMGDGSNISPLSLKEELQVRGPSTRLEFAFRAIRRGWIGHTDGPLLLARIVRLFLSPDAYRKVANGFTKGQLRPEAAYALTLALLPVPGRLAQLGIKELSFNYASSVLTEGTRVLGMGEGLRYGYSIGDPGTSALLASKLVRHIAVQAEKLVARNQQAQGAWVDWACNYPRATAQFLRLIAGWDRGVHARNFELRDELEESAELFHTVTPIDEHVGLPNPIPAYLRVVDRFGQMTIFPDYNNPKCLTPKVMRRDNALRNVTDLLRCLNILGVPTEQMDGMADPKPQVRSPLHTSGTKESP